jgi:hypothetical protein
MLLVLSGNPLRPIPKRTQREFFGDSFFRVFPCVSWARHLRRHCDHYTGGCPPAAYDTSQNGLLPGRLPARVLLFDWGQLRPVYEPALELTEKPYLKDPTRPEADNLDTIFLWRDEMTVLSGDGKLSDANGWWTAWAGRGDVLLTRLRPKAFTLPGYDPPDDALSDSPPVEIDASDMNPWVAEVMTVIVRALAVNPGVGTLELFAGDGLHVFTADGTQELTLPLSVDLANPSGPLADTVNADNPQDVMLLMEANIPVERTMVELIYSQNGEEMARDEVHCSVVGLTVQGGYTRGSVRYSAAMNLKGSWVVFRDFDANRPITVLIPEPSHEAGGYRSVWYRQSTDPEQEWKKDGWLLDGSYFVDLVEQWNALLDLLHIPFEHYNADEVLVWLSQATGISLEVLQSGRYLVAGLIDEAGEYEIRLLDNDQNLEQAKQISVHVSKPGEITGQFRIIGDELTPYFHEVDLEDVPEYDQNFFWTLGGMRLHLAADFAPLLEHYASEIVGYDWYITQDGQFQFSEAAFAKGVSHNLRDDLAGQGVPEAVIDALQGILENRYVKDGLFPDYFATDPTNRHDAHRYDGLRALRWEGNHELRERSYANEDDLVAALRTTTKVGDASRYAVAGYRVSRQVLARSRATHDSSSYEPADQLAWKIPYDIYLKIEQSSALRGGEGGPGWSYRIVTNGEFLDFKHALHNAVGSAAYDEIVMRYAAHLRLFTPTIQLLTSHGNYYTRCRDLLVKHGRLHTGQLYPDYRTTLDYLTISEETLEHLNAAGLPEEILTILKEKLLDQIFLTEEEFLNTLKHADMLGKEATTTHQAALVRWAKTAPPLPDDECQRRKTLASDALGLRKEIYWQGEARPDLNEVIHLSLTFGKRMRDDQIEVLGTIPITRRIKSRVLELKNPAMTGDDVKMLQAVLRSIGMSQKDDPGYLGVPVEITGEFGSTADISCTNRALGRLEYIDEVIIKKPDHQSYRLPDGDVKPVDVDVLNKINSH